MEIILSLLGGLGLFVYGMNQMSHGIEKVAGNKLRSILAAFTKNQFTGLAVGLFFTAVIQSSSAATVMVVSFVNAGLMKLTEACGIILGANIGTTVTALLVAFKLSTIAPVFIFVGVFMIAFMKKAIIKKSGEIVLGFGLLFFGISIMSDSMAALREIPSFIDFMAKFTNPILGILLGLVITSVVQSSSVTVSILVVMASQGLVNLDLCMFVILGCNIGACTSAVLTSLNGSKNAKRAALIHLLFNIFGTILMFVLLIIQPVREVIKDIIYFVSGSAGATDSASLGRNIAIAHFTFKVFQVIVFYPFMKYIVKLTYVLVPGEDAVTEDNNSHSFKLQFIGQHKLPDPSVAIYFAIEEMERMANMAINNLNLAMQCAFTKDIERSKEVYHTEEYIDFLNEEISDYLVRINQNALPLGDANLIAAYFHVVNDIERIGDHAENIVDMIPQCIENNIEFSDKSMAEVNGMLDEVNQILQYSVNMFVTGNMEHMKDVSNIEDHIDLLERQLQKKHIRRLNEGKCSAQSGLYMSEIISGLERVSDHATNIAFSLTEADTPETSK